MLGAALVLVALLGGSSLSQEAARFYPHQALTVMFPSSASFGVYAFYGVIHVMFISPLLALSICIVEIIAWHCGPIGCKGGWCCFGGDFTI